MDSELEGKKFSIGGENGEIENLEGALLDVTKEKSKGGESDNKRQREAENNYESEKEIKLEGNEFSVGSESAEIKNHKEALLDITKEISNGGINEKEKQNEVENNCESEKTIVPESNNCQTKSIDGIENANNLDGVKTVVLKNHIEKNGSIEIIDELKEESGDPSPGKATGVQNGDHIKININREIQNNEVCEQNHLPVQTFGTQKGGDMKSAYIGLTKEELMKYANDPFWIRLRWFLFITFWLLWGAMLIGAIMIIYAAPKCNPPPPKTWWEQGPLTEVGDIPTTEELKSFEKGKVKGVIVPWPEDTYNEFNSTHSFVTFLKNAKELDVNIIVDLEPGTSTLWFNSSVEKDPVYNDYYIWRPPGKSTDPAKIEPPNNWLTKDNKSSWIYSNPRKEFYYAPQGKPLLNFRNHVVKEEFSEVLKRFLQNGASGVRLQGVPFLLFDPSFADQVPISKESDDDLKSYSFYRHTKTEDLNDLGPILQHWRTIVKNQTAEAPFLMADQLLKLDSYKVNDSLVVDLPLQAQVFNEPIINVTEVAKKFEYIFNVQNLSWPLWTYNTSAVPMDVLDIATFLLPGTVLRPCCNSTINPELIAIRNSPSVLRGDLNFTTINNNTAFAYTRVTAGNPGILVALNPTNERITADFSHTFESVPDEVTIQYFSKNYNETDFTISKKIKSNNIPISAHAAIVLSYVPVKKDD